MESEKVAFQSVGAKNHLCATMIPVRDMKLTRTFVAVLLCIPLAGCAVTMYGNQSTSGGTTATTTSSQVGGSVQGANYRASFSSGGRPVSPRASGGYVSVSGNAAAVLVGVVVFADLWNYFRGESHAKPLPPGTAISQTCSCYGYQPPAAGDQ